VWKTNLSGQNGSDPDQSGRRRHNGQGGALWRPDKSVSSGIYLIRAATSDGKTATKRIVYLK